MRTLGVVAVLAALVGIGGWWITSSEPDWYARVRYPLRYERLITSHARTYDLDPALLAAVVYTESRFDPGAVSGAGAIGLMQLLPETAKGIAIRTGGDRFVVSDLYDPELNLRYGSWYLRNLLRRYDGDVPVALAAYHAGQGNVDRWRASGQGIAFPETRAYVEKVERLRKVYSSAYAKELRAP
jgi:soluble lytic murein transglycosylase